MYFLQYFAFCASITLATWVKPAGWLDRLVQYHKKSFIKEVNELAPVQIEARVTAREPGYVESTDWDFNSVIRLLELIRSSERAKPVVHVLRRMLRRSPTRRFMDRILSYKYFPSLIQKNGNEFYYDGLSNEVYKGEYKERNTTSSVPDDNAIIVIRNPVESRMPSSHISVKLLRQILENRAIAGKRLPTTSSTKKPTTVNQKKTTVDQKTTTVDQKTTTVDQKTTTVDQKITTVDQKITTVDQNTTNQ